MKKSFALMALLISCLSLQTAQASVPAGSTAPATADPAGSAANPEQKIQKDERDLQNSPWDPRKDPGLSSADQKANSIEAAQENAE